MKGFEAFASPELYTFGNAQGNGLYRYPGVVNVDTTLTKGFKMRERITAELRGEFYNFFNHANFAAPDVSLGSPNFGRVSGAANARKAQVGMKIYF